MASYFLKNEYFSLFRLAEIFGTELVQHTKYHFNNGAKIAIYTYHGCTIEVPNSYQQIEIKIVLSHFSLNNQK